MCVGSSSLGKFLGALDSTYNSMFQDATWKDTFEKSENQRSGNIYLLLIITYTIALPVKRDATNLMF